MQYNLIIRHGTIIDGSGRMRYQGDITIFDHATLGTAATFHSPAVFPSGIEHVIINGRPVLAAGELQKDTLAGAVIRRTD